MNARERDASVEKLLREAMAAEVRSDGPQCLDAETLAAWSDGHLAGPARATAEAHASRCARCQAMLAAMVRSSDVAHPAAAAASPIRKWLMMLSPIAAAAAAVTVWFAVDRGTVQRPSESQRTATSAVSQVAEGPTARTVPSPPPDTKETAAV